MALFGFWHRGQEAAGAWGEHLGLCLLQGLFGGAGREGQRRGCTAHVYMHATTASKQGMEMGTSFWGCSWPIGSQGFYRAPNTAGSAPGPRGRTCSFTFTPSTVSTLF